MKQTALFLALLLSAGVQAQAQTTGIDGILRQIEANNKELQANAQLITSQKLEQHTNNNLPDPTVTYAHVWDSDDSDITASELVVSQGFDFPILYTTRHRMNRLREGALDAQATAMRQEVLLRAHELCIDIIMLHRQQELFDLRLQDAELLAASSAKRLETGDASVLETNKINLELLNIRTEARLNSAALVGKMKELIALNGDRPLTPGRMLPNAVPDAKALELTEYPAVPLPTDFAPLCDELVATDPALLALTAESSAARRQVAVNRQQWLPKLQVGYRRNTDSGHPLNGVVVGMSLPLFENRGKVNIAKKQQQSLENQQENARLQTAARLWQLYEEAHSLHATIREYEETFSRQQDLTMLRKALDGGQMSLTDYLNEEARVYQSHTNLLQLQNRYQKAMAQIYKSRL